MSAGPRRSDDPQRTELRRLLETSDDPHVQRAVGFARLLDDRFVDPLVGFFLPGAGDLITAGAGVYIVFAALRRGLPAAVIARMFLNLAIDMVVGAVPGVGDLFDLAFKANKKNAKLLVERQPGDSTGRDWLVVVGAATLFLAALAVPIILLLWALGALGGR